MAQQKSTRHTVLPKKSYNIQTKGRFGLGRPTQDSTETLQTHIKYGRKQELTDHRNRQNRKHHIHPQRRRTRENSIPGFPSISHRNNRIQKTHSHRSVLTMALLQPRQAIHKKQTKESVTKKRRARETDDRFKDIITAAYMRGVPEATEQATRKRRIGTTVTPPSPETNYTRTINVT